MTKCEDVMSWVECVRALVTTCNNKQQEISKAAFEPSHSQTLLFKQILLF